MLQRTALWVYRPVIACREFTAAPSGVGCRADKISDEKGVLRYPSGQASMPEGIDILGVITIEDIVEEMISEEIMDEHDISEAGKRAVERDHSVSLPEARPPAIAADDAAQRNASVRRPSLQHLLFAETAVQSVAVQKAIGPLLQCLPTVPVENVPRCDVRK
jgi:hypothetical protein